MATPHGALRGFRKQRPLLRGFLDESRYKVPEEPYRCFSWAGDSERTSELSTSQPSPRPRSRTPGATARNLSLQPPGPPRGDGWALTPGAMEIHSTHLLPSDGHRRLARRGQLRICGLRWQGLQKAPTESAFLTGKGSPYVMTRPELGSGTAAPAVNVRTFTSGQCDMRCPLSHTQAGLPSCQPSELRPPPGGDTHSVTRPATSTPSVVHDESNSDDKRHRRP